MEIRREILEKLIKMENYLEELEKIYPSFYTDLERVSKKISFLEKNKEKLKKIIEVKNSLIYSHYEKMDDKELYSIIKDSLQLFRDFIQEIREWSLRN